MRYLYRWRNAKHVRFLYTMNGFWELVPLPCEGGIGWFWGLLPSRTWQPPTPSR